MYLNAYSITLAQFHRTLSNFTHTPRKVRKKTSISKIDHYHLVENLVSKENSHTSAITEKLVLPFSADLNSSVIDKESC